MYEIRLETFEVVMVFKNKTNSLIETTQKAKVTESMNPKAHLHTETIMTDDSKDRTPLGVEAVTFTLVKVEIRRLEYQYQHLSHYTV